LHRSCVTVKALYPLLLIVSYEVRLSHHLSNVKVSDFVGVYA
jgi:hypothetical protein